MNETQRRRTQQEELAEADTRPSVVVDDAAEYLEQPRKAMDFVQDDQPGRLRAKEGVRVFQATPISRAFKVKVDRACWP